MSKKYPWLCAGTAALALVLNQRAILADDPPQEEQVEIEVHESVQQVAEQAAEAAKAIAAEAAAEAQETAAKIAAEAAEHAQKAAEEVVEEVTKAAGEAAKQARITGIFTPAPYQLGLQVAPVSKSLDAQLKLEGKGILIDVVEKDGPGAKAGLQPHDIVITVGEHDVKSPADLSKTLTDSEGKELKFDVIRGGEELTIMVQPRSTVKTSGSININVPKIEVDEEIIRLESKIREKLKGAGVDVRMHVIHPGQMIPDDVLLKRAKLPEGVSISVRKEGGKPTKVEVSRGEEKWELTEESLDKLPEDLRPHVAHMLGRGPIGIGFPPNVKFTAPMPPGVVIAPAPPAGLAVAERRAAGRDSSELKLIVRRLDEIKKDINRLYDQIDELREDRKKD
jgi:membrane-associated protease RseP (regulator of RpoE activity)